VNAIPSSPPPAGVGPAGSASSAPVPAPTRPRPAAPVATARAIDPPAPTQTVARLDEQITRAAGALFAGREVAVETRHDEATGRVVVRIRDRASGEVMAQMPPEELLRFWAAVRGETRLVDTRT
jgi:hypothetical protein